MNQTVHFIGTVIALVFMLTAHVVAFYGAYLLHAGAVYLLAALVLWRIGRAFAESLK